MPCQVTGVLGHASMVTPPVVLDGVDVYPLLCLFECDL